MTDKMQKRESGQVSRDVAKVHDARVRLPYCGICRTLHRRPNRVSTCRKPAAS